VKKLKYELILPKNIEQLKGLFTNLLKSKSKHIILKIIPEYIEIEALVDILNQHQTVIKNYKKNKSIVILTDNYVLIPDFIPVAPTEEEALDIIDFENIERDLLYNE